MKRNEETESRGEKARAGKTKSPLENWCRGTPAAWRDSNLVLALLHRDAMDLLLRE